MVDKNTTMNTSNEIENDGEGDDTIVTMVDVLKEEEMMQENIDAVLGPADDQNCTFEDVSVKIKMFLVLTKIRYQLSELKKNRQSGPNCYDRCKDYYPTGYLFRGGT